MTTPKLMTRARCLELVYQELAASDEEDYARLGQNINLATATLLKFAEELALGTRNHGLGGEYCPCSSCALLREFEGR